MCPLTHDLSQSPQKTWHKFVWPINDQCFLDFFTTLFVIAFLMWVFFFGCKNYSSEMAFLSLSVVYERHIHPSVSRKVWLMQIVAKGPISGLPSNQTVHSLINTHQKKIEKKVYDVRNVNLLSSVCPDRILATCLELRTGGVDSRWYLVFAQVFRLIIGTQSHVS